jgi:hypothetical protein
VKGSSIFKVLLAVNMEERERDIRERIFSISTDSDFDDVVWMLFRFQYDHNPLYREFARLNGRTPATIQLAEQIPFLPVAFFRNHEVLTGQHPPQEGLRFMSSGTTGSTPSTHRITDPALYRESFTRGFERVFGTLSDYRIFALLPSYLERGNSSLVYMADHLIRGTGSGEGGFYSDNYPQLLKDLYPSGRTHKKTLLLGVTFALLEFMPMLTAPVPGLILVETGGMKGRSREMIREELYLLLKEGYRVRQVCSEYGMTEMCTQAWSLDQGIYHPPPWMRVLIRDLNDPFSILEPGKRGAVNIIDLANLYSCAFLATEDLGVVHRDGSFEILGRADGSEIRGCNLMFTG